jgi:anti-sigma-K factor RskA
MIPQEMQNTIAFIIEQQAKFEENFTRAEHRFARVEKRLDGWRNWRNAWCARRGAPLEISRLPF